MTEETTEAKRPVPKRPAIGLQAWQSTLGYISTHHSPDAILKLQAYSREARVLWSASVSWGQKRESVTDQGSLGLALGALWMEVVRGHAIFENLEDAVRAPVYYNEVEWLDDMTQESLQRLIWVTQLAFPGDWMLMIMYQPVENATTRVQMRLVAKDSTVTVGGSGGNMLDACSALFRNATPHYSGQAGKKS
jgi:hypothetical protein